MTTTSRSTTMLATLAAAVGLVLPGCGDDDPSGPTRAEFVQRADAACDKWDARIDRAQGEEELARLIDGLFDELDSLPTPEGDEEEVDGIVASGRAELEGLTRGDEGEGEPFAEFSRRAAAYGLEACAASTRD
jgi:hypothetical protein